MMTVKTLTILLKIKLLRLTIKRILHLTSDSDPDTDVNKNDSNYMGCNH